MASAALLRKTMLWVLNNRLLPDLLGKSELRLVLAGIPLDVPAGVAMRELDHPPLMDEKAAKPYPEGRHWNDVAMHAIRFPALHCVVEGEADLLMGVTVAMRRLAGLDDTRPCGGYVFALKAPAYFLVPPDVPQKTTPPWHRDSPHRGLLRLFTLRLLPVGALCTLSVMQDSVYTVEYTLFVKDSQIAAAAGLLLDELGRPRADKRIARAQLLTIMLRVKRQLGTNVPQMTDGLYSLFPDTDPGFLTAHLAPNSVIDKAHRYIQLHLHEALAPDAIAGHVRMAPDHLNRLFKANCGLTTMSYVATVRMEAARLLLRDSVLSVQEISRLVGYRQLPHFSRTFARHTGQSPLKYRQQGEGQAGEG